MKKNHPSEPKPFCDGLRQFIVDSCLGCPMADAGECSLWETSHEDELEEQNNDEEEESL